MLCACAHGPDIKERIAPAIQAYYKFHDTRLVHFGLLHKKPTEAHKPSVLVTTGILRPQDSPPLNGDWIEGIERVCEWRRDFAAASFDATKCHQAGATVASAGLVTPPGRHSTRRSR